MATVRFYLKDSTKNETSIFARVSFGYYETNNNGTKVHKHLKYSTGETVNPQYWDKTTNRAKLSKQFPQHPEFNQRLNDIETAINDVFRKMLNDGKGNEITPEILRDNVNSHLEKINKVVKPVNNKTGFTEFVKMVIIESVNGNRTTDKGKRFKPFTLKSYRTTLKNLIDYETEKRKTLKFSDITIDFYNKFLKFLNDKGRAVNTVGGHIKNIKVFMKIANSRGLTDNREFEKREFKTIEEETENIYLTEQELQTLYDLDLSKNNRLATTRDMFIIGCFTGLRFSDLKQLTKEHFSEDYIKISTEKTNENVVIPLHWTVREICKKYEYSLPRVISNQKMNDYLKELGQLAAIDEIVINNKTKGGLKFERKTQKYKLITVHTARRSFATNMFINDVPTLSIMKITGHRTEKSFLKYIKITPEENAKKLLQHPFFNQSKVLKVV